MGCSNSVFPSSEPTVKPQEEKKFSGDNFVDKLSAIMATKKPIYKSEDRKTSNWTVDAKDLGIHIGRTTPVPKADMQQITELKSVVDNHPQSRKCTSGSNDSVSTLILDECVVAVLWPGGSSLVFSIYRTLQS